MSRRGVMPKHVVILGCGRGGTSMLGELFEALSCYRYFFHSDWDTVRDLDYSGGAVALKRPRAATGAPMTPGLPFVIEEFLKSIPEPRAFFWQVRHPLDSICSLRPGIEAGWWHSPKPPDWEEWLCRPLVERCAYHWAYVNGPGYEAIREFSVVNKYEDMIASPHNIALRICVEAGVDTNAYAGEIRRWAELVSNEKSDQSYEAKHQDRWSRLDHHVRVGRWRENLSSDEVRSVLPIVSKAAGNFAYELPTV
jgi:hypothetical protein